MLNEHELGQQFTRDMRAAAETWAIRPAAGG
jgi:hypothetical protein